ncbi:pre-mRNA-splicing factor RBM22/SLT11 [Pycnococcus provasolii]
MAMSSHHHQPQQPARPSQQTSRMAASSSIDNKDSVDFPLICETCLGPNPYVRMLKYPNHKECPITSRPFTVFRFRPGGSESRYKSTVISKEAAKIKNVCQVCLFDLEYGLPSSVVSTLGAGPASAAIDAPRSAVNKEYFYEGLATNTIGAGAGAGTRAIAAAEAATTPENDEHLRRLARNRAPDYRRNKHKLCSFWLAKSCTRCQDGHSCTYRPCNGDWDFVELSEEENAELQKILQEDGVSGAMRRDDEVMTRLRKALHRSFNGNVKSKISSRYHGKNDAMASAMLAKVEERKAAAAEAGGGGGSGGGGVGGQHDASAAAHSEAAAAAAAGAAAAYPSMRADAAGSVHAAKRARKE